jgi:hypothetical protein
VRRLSGDIAEASLITALVFGLIAGSALAAKGGGSAGGKGGAATGSFSLVLVDSTDGIAHYGQNATFAVSSTAAKPMVNLTCYQGGDWVTNQSVGFYAGWPWSTNFPLSSWKWTGGAADCTATLYYQTSKGTKVMSTMAIHVEA